MKPVPEADLHAYVDGQLDAARREELAQHLAASPEDAARVAAYQRQNHLLHALFDPVLAEAVPAGMNPKRGNVFPTLRVAASLGWLAVGGLLGWFMHGTEPAAPNGMVSMPRYAAVAHVVYTPEVRHPVEVGSDQETHLVAWLSKRLGKPVKAPQLNSIGFNLVGGVCCPAKPGPPPNSCTRTPPASALRCTCAPASSRTAKRPSAMRRKGMWACSIGWTAPSGMRSPAR